MVVRDDDDGTAEAQQGITRTIEEIARRLQEMERELEARRPLDSLLTEEPLAEQDG
jgi:hypothetical protein